MLLLDLPPLPPLEQYESHFRGLIGLTIRTVSLSNYSTATRHGQYNLRATTFRSGSRPSYNMSTRATPQLLSKKAIHHHLRNGTGVPSLRRHECVIRTIALFHQEWSPHSKMSVSTLPPPLKRLCDHFNEFYLFQPDDLHINARLLWAILFRREYSKINVKSMSHPYMYVQQRHAETDEVKGQRLLRRKSLCKKQFGQDFKKIATNTSIYLPTSRAMMYGVIGLDNRDHGSVAEISHSNRVMDKLGIITHDIRPTRANEISTISANGIYVAYDTNPIFLELQNKTMKGIHTMHHELTTSLLTMKYTDPSRAGLKIFKLEKSVNFRCRFGFGRIQATPAATANLTVIHWLLDEKKMPTIKYEPFVKLPKSLKDELIILFECADNFVRRNMPGMFSNRKRFQCAKKLNEVLGYPKAKMRFEYYDIVITRNIVLPKHIDQKNDHRIGYNYCVVYSFYHCIEGLEYKVSVIMTSRCTIGAALESKN